MIQQAAALMSDFDANAARVFLAQPFNRAAMAAAFRKGFRVHSDLTLRICDCIDRAVAFDRAERQVGG